MKKCAHCIKTFNCGSSMFHHRLTNFLDVFFLHTTRFREELIGKTHDFLFQSLGQKVLFGDRETLLTNLCSGETTTGMPFANSRNSFKIQAVVPTIISQHLCTYRSMGYVVSSTVTMDVRRITLPYAQIMQKGALDYGFNIHLGR